MWWLSFAVIVLLLFDVVAAANDGFLSGEKLRLILTLGAMMAGLPEDDQTPVPSRSLPRDHCNRNRNNVFDMFEQYGPYYTRRAYRMTSQSFYRLHKILHPYLKPKRRRGQRRGAKNGCISSQIRLSAALRYFAGGRPDDISLSHGISHSEVFTSVWKVVDAVNRSKQLNFKYPTDHQEQQGIAAGFARKSKAGFKCCAGAIDCMLVWLERPSEKSCAVAQVGAQKFFCGRKHKYGLCLQAVCDSEGRFLDVYIGHPASTSDFMAFTASKMGRRMESDGFIAPGLCLFGDMAYVNNKNMATPFQRVSSGSKDDYNFYHSQVRIKIECAFGMLVNRYIMRFATIAAHETFDTSKRPSWNQFCRHGLDFQIDTV